jgi:hypothetical protein
MWKARENYYVFMTLVNKKVAPILGICFVLHCTYLYYLINDKSLRYKELRCLPYLIFTN